MRQPFIRLRLSDNQAFAGRFYDLLTYWGCKPKPPKIPSPLLQLRHPVAAAHEVRGERQRESPGADQEAVACGVAPHPPQTGTTRSAATDSSSTWMRSWRGWSWGDGIFGGSGLDPQNREFGGGWFGVSFFHLCRVTELKRHSNHFFCPRIDPPMGWL
jgi:hypothetical protein